MKKLVVITLYVSSMLALDMPPSYEQAEAEKYRNTFIEFCTAYETDQSRLLSYSEVVSLRDLVQKYSSQEPEVNDALFELRAKNVVRCFKKFKDPNFQKYLRKYPQVFSEMFLQKKLWEEIIMLIDQKNTDARLQAVKKELEETKFLDKKGI
ncbi:MAG: hypothetical protein K2X90_01160 [Candidatus Babeliaceae bacterium]|nr:hypothetical protein [Candidatus Babeliaceae bacterium]